MVAVSSSFEDLKQSSLYYNEGVLNFEIRI